ncbi:MAG: protein kinase [Chloroflexota bacterium]
MPFNAGENVGPYRIIEQLGQGGMATVYKAYHASLDRYVALKVLHPAFTEDQTFIARFQREARLVAKLDHPHIVPVYDFSSHEGRPYLVMKFIEGETLKARMARGPLESGELSRIIEAVGAGLAYAHKTGILHRDIKPSNVLLAPDGSIYLADFGLARIAQAGESTLSSDQIMGTPQYISPEQAMGKKDLDEGTDIYSFGVMLYEMVVGQVPFSADTPFSIIHDHIYSPLPMPRVINPNVPESVERVLLKALAKERADRFADVTSMVAAFEQAWQAAGIPMQGTSVTLASKKAAPGPSVKTEARPVPQAVAAKEARPKKGRWWAGCLTAALVVLCLFAAFIVIRNNRQPPDGPGTTATAKSPATEAATRPSTSLPPKDEPTPVVSPVIQAALERVKKNPEDPYAHLDLAVAYWDADQPRLAYEALTQATVLAGENEAFFLDAARVFEEREAWVGAAGMYLRAVRTHPINEPYPPELKDHLNESVYKASIQPDMPAYLPFESITRVDEPLSLAAQSRHAFYNINQEEGLAFLNQLKRLQPEYALAQLLDAEYNMRQGNNPKARLQLNDLLANLDTPPWLRVVAQDYLNQLP